MFYIDKLQKNISLAPYTTFKIGGPAKYFYIAKTIEDLINAVGAARKARVLFFIFGAGSNILVSDKGFDGLVIKIQNTNYKIQNTKIVAEAGTRLGDLTLVSVEAGLTGLEWAAGIPGSIGGVIRGNAGAFGGSMADITKTVKVLEPKIRNPKSKTFKNQDCKFGYRDSIFKHNKNLIIFSAELELKKGDKKSSREMIREYLKKRQETQPLEFPSAGCIFKNPKGYSAGWLIEQCGLKGKRVGKAMISEKHANFIVNAGGAKARDAIELINLCKEKVKEKFKIELEEELEYLGEF